MQYNNREAFIVQTIDTLRSMALLSVYQLGQEGYIINGLAASLAASAETQWRRGEVKRAAACAAVVEMLTQVNMAVLGVAVEAGVDMNVAQDADEMSFGYAARLLSGLPEHLLPRRVALRNAVEVLKEHDAALQLDRMTHGGSLYKYAVAVAGGLDADIPPLFFFGPMMIYAAVERGVDAERHAAALEMVAAATQGLVAGMAAGADFHRVIVSTVDGCARPLLEKGDEEAVRQVAAMQRKVLLGRREVTERSGGLN